MSSSASLRSAIQQAFTTGRLGFSHAQLARSEGTVRVALLELTADPAIAAPALRDTVRRTALRDVLLDWLVSPDAPVRIASAKLAGRLQLQDAVPWLERMAAEADAGIRRTAIRGLGGMRSSFAADALLRRIRATTTDRGLLIAELARCAPDQYLGEALRSAPAPSTEAAIMLALGMRGGDGAVPHLLVRLDSGSAGTRACASRALGYTRAASAMTPLLVSSLDRSPRVRAEAQRAMRRLSAAAQGGIRRGPAEAC